MCPVCEIGRRSVHLRSIIQTASNEAKEAVAGGTVSSHAGFFKICFVNNRAESAASAVRWPCADRMAAPGFMGAVCEFKCIYEFLGESTCEHTGLALEIDNGSGVTTPPRFIVACRAQPIVCNQCFQLFPLDFINFHETGASSPQERRARRKQRSARAACGCAASSRR